MLDNIKETAKENKDMINLHDGDSSNNPDVKALQFYFENRARINNL